MCVASPFSVYLCCLSPVLFLYLWEKCLLSRPFVPFFFVYSFSRLPMEFEALLRTTTSCMNKNNIILQLRTCYLNGNIFCRITRLGVDYHRSKCCHSIVVIVAQNFWNSWLSKSPLWSKMQGHRKINGGFAKLWPSPFHFMLKLRQPSNEDTVQAAGIFVPTM